MARKPNVDEFDTISLTQIGARFMNNREECIKWLREFGLLAAVMIRPLCNLQYSEQLYTRSVDGITWRCMVIKCKQTINIRFFEKSKLELWKIIGITYIWTALKEALAEVGGRRKKIHKKNWMLDAGKQFSDWNQFCRDVAVNYFLNNPVQLGGPGRVLLRLMNLFFLAANITVAELWKANGCLVDTSQQQRKVF